MLLQRQSAKIKPHYPSGFACGESTSPDKGRQGTSAGLRISAVPKAPPLTREGKGLWQISNAPGNP